MHVARRSMQVMPQPLRTPWNLNQSPYLLRAFVRLLAVSEGELFAACAPCGWLLETRHPDLTLCKTRRPDLALCKTRAELALRKTRAGGASQPSSSGTSPLSCWQSRHWAAGNLAVELLAVSPLGCGQSRRRAAGNLAIGLLLVSPSSCWKSRRRAACNLAIELLALPLDIVPAPSSMYIPNPAGFDDDVLPFFEAQGLSFFEALDECQSFKALDEGQSFEALDLDESVPLANHLPRQENLSVTSYFAAASALDSFGAASTLGSFAAASASDTFGALSIHPNEPSQPSIHLSEPPTLTALLPAQ
ncbi:hypothetical protein K525DRAFT_253448 [Schizophyllum commune Loenen D]|nr:hypothetical protein K525DRAFT_253448 [Schizophyllum commune Loenen D]